MDIIIVRLLNIQASSGVTKRLWRDFEYVNRKMQAKYEAWLLIEATRNGIHLSLIHNFRP